jgi:hypothetical protein
MSDIISNLTPNANLAQGCFDEPIRIDSINMTELKITNPPNNFIDSMAAPNNVESIGDVSVEITGNKTTFKAE